MYYNQSAREIRPEMRNPIHKFARPRRVLWIAFGAWVAFAFFVVFLALCQVPRALTPRDIAILHDKFSLQANTQALDYAIQIRQIRQIQKTLFRLSPGDAAIPPGQSREPADLVRNGHGQCFDRSRTLDKALRYVGYQTRYASLYARPPGWSAWQVLMHPAGPDMRSHALIEVRTARGWMFVDSISPFLALDNTEAPISLASWQSQNDKENFQWRPQPGAQLYPLMKGDFIVIYGLYARHGYAYPPFIPVPDVDWFALLENL